MTTLTRVPNTPPATTVRSSASADALIHQFDQLLDQAAARVDSHPWLVVMVLHEVFRNLYPHDPYLPFDSVEPHASRIARVMAECTARLRLSANWPSYFGPREVGTAATPAARPTNDAARATEGDTQQLYGSFWDQFDTNTYINEASRILSERFGPAGVVDGLSPSSVVLDAGCGSGRYAMALARLCPARVIGVDLGAASLAHARRIAARADITNIAFQHGDVLALPFPDASIDFVFSNGVLHHTGDTARGLREMHRVLRPGGRAFLYLYGAGGLFWHARRAAREVMWRIPRDYAADTLRLIGMPANRFIFMDTWYVPVEEHISRNDLESLLRETGFARAQKLVSGRHTDLDSASVMAAPDASSLWGDGEHRYLLTK